MNEIQSILNEYLVKCGKIRNMRKRKVSRAIFDYVIIFCLLFSAFKGLLVYYGVNKDIISISVPFFTSIYLIMALILWQKKEVEIEAAINKSKLKNILNYKEKMMGFRIQDLVVGEVSQKACEIIMEKLDKNEDIENELIILSRKT